MSEQRYDFPVFKIQGVPFVVDGATYCYKQFAIVYKDGQLSHLSRDSRNIDEWYDQLTYHYVRAFYLLPKEIRYTIVENARHNSTTWNDMWKPISIFIGEQYQYEIELYIVVYNQLAAVIHGKPIDNYPELKHWICQRHKNGEQEIDAVRKKQQQRLNRTITYTPKKDWWDRACEFFIGF